MEKKNDSNGEAPDTIEKELHQTQRLLETVLESPSDILIRCIDTNYKYLLFNQAYKKALSAIYGKEIALGTDIFDCITIEEDKTKTKNSFAMALSGKAHTTIDEYGSSVRSYFETHFYPIFNDNGNIIGASAYSQNITVRRQTEISLKESEAKFRNIFTESPVGKLMVGLDKKIITCNKSFCNFIGYSEDELIGKTIADITYAEDIELGMPELKQIAEGTLESSTIHKRYQRKDGCIAWGEIKISLIRNEQNKPMYFLPVIQDITARKQSEEERERLNHKIAQMQKLESLGILAGGIAHDFNNLMGGIFGYIDLASECSKDPNVIDYLDKALATISRARGLTQQLLTFAKGGAPIQKIGNLFPCIKDAVQFALSGSNISCLFNISEDLYQCNYDKNQISQVVDNVIINAQHAMPTGGRIELVAENIELEDGNHLKLTEGSYIKISIKDNGIGIPKELIPLIFDPFFTTKSKGHGLGLATCYSIINRHSRAIDVESEQGKGSTFHIYLPAAKENTLSDVVSTIVNHEGRGVFIVMDDEEVMRDTIGNMLKTLGYTVKCTSNGHETLKLLENDNTNRLIIGLVLDLTIPGSMGGKEAVSEIRKLNSNIPVFVTSGYADDPVMQNPSKYGFTASICKPFMKIEFVNMLSKFLKNT
jgi:PAS domain S-box-containing protein